MFQINLFMHIKRILNHYPPAFRFLSENGSTAHHKYPLQTFPSEQENIHVCIYIFKYIYIYIRIHVFVYVYLAGDTFLPRTIFPCCTKPLDH